METFIPLQYNLTVTMSFTEMLIDIGKIISSFAIAILSGRYGLEGVIMGNIQTLDYILLTVMLFTMLYSFYMVNQLKQNSY